MKAGRWLLEVVVEGARGGGLWDRKRGEEEGVVAEVWEVGVEEEEEEDDEEKEKVGAAPSALVAGAVLILGVAPTQEPWATAAHRRQRMASASWGPQDLWQTGHGADEGEDGEDGEAVSTVTAWTRAGVPEPLFLLRGDGDSASGCQECSCVMDKIGHMRPVSCVSSSSPSNSVEVGGWVSNLYACNSEGRARGQAYQ